MNGLDKLAIWVLLISVGYMAAKSGFGVVGIILYALGIVYYIFRIVIPDYREMKRYNRAKAASSRQWE